MKRDHHVENITCNEEVSLLPSRQVLPQSKVANELTDLGQTIRRLRERSGTKAVVLAKLSGVNPRTIAAIETGRIKNPSLKNLQAIAEALGVQFAEFFIQPETEKPESVHEGDQKGEFVVGFQKHGVRLISFVPINSDLFIGKAVLEPKAKVETGQIALLGKVFIQIIFGKLKCFVNGEELLLREGGHLLLNGRFVRSFENPLMKEVTFLLVNSPSSFSPAKSHP